MCMNHTEFTMKRAKDGTFYGVGYKALGLDSTNGLSARSVKLKRGVWVKDKRNANITGSDKNYAPGFHIFPSLIASKAYSGNANIFEVHFRDIVAFGAEFAGVNQTCIIAREIKVVKQVQKYPG